jgi:hypothetical protein
MRGLLPLALVLLVTPVVAQPTPAGTTGSPGSGETHFFAEVLGASPLLSFNLEHEVLPHAVVRGGLGFSPAWAVDGFAVSGVAGVGFVPLDGAFRPEVGVSVTGLSDDDLGVLPAGFLGLRIRTSDRSLLRLGASLLYLPGEPLVGPVLPWPSLGFGGRL